LERSYGLFLFDATSQALKAESLIKAAGVSLMVIPAPVEFTAGCGISLLVGREDLDAAKGALSGCEGHTVMYPYIRKGP
jgi:hypothetical protein